MASAPSDALSRVVVDANVFFVPPVRDLLFFGGARADPLLEILWSEAILLEVARNWARVTGSREAAVRWRRFEARFRVVFGAGRVADTVALGPGSGVAIEDRHVVGTALAARATGIVTLNTRDFPRAELATLGLRRWHPDHLLLELLASQPARLAATLREQGGALRHPRTLPESVALLQSSCPHFAAQARTLLTGRD